MSALLLVPLVALPAVAANVEICVNVGVTYDDLAGDYWIDNSVARDGRGIEITVDDPSADPPDTMNLGSDGCIITAVATGQSTITVRTYALVNGVEIESWSGPADGARPPGEAVFTRSSSNPTWNLWVPGNNQRWRNVMAATMVFRESTWGIDQPPNRACCHTGEALDGTCGTPANEYVPIGGPVQMQALDSAQFDCCQSRLVDGNGAATDTDSGNPGVFTSTNSSFKFTIAHELGHVIAFKRAGGQENIGNGTWPSTEGCNGAWKDGALADRGLLRKGFVAETAKEGWAEFVSAATWNDEDEASCDQQAISASFDWDTSGNAVGIDIDPGSTWYSFFGGTATRTNQGVTVQFADLTSVLDCGGDPEMEGLSLQYTWTEAGYFDDVNWLDDAESVGGFHPCSRLASNWNEGNRSTKYDFTRMWWDLLTDQELERGELSHLHVDTCFRTWASSDTSVQDYQKLPLYRYLESADTNTIDAEFDAEVDHVAH